jgi:hypothetical protein
MERCGKILFIIPPPPLHEDNGWAELMVSLSPVEWELGGVHDPNHIQRISFVSFALGYWTLPHFETLIQKGRIKV